MTPVYLAGLIFFAFVISASLTAMMRWISAHIGFVARPRDDRYHRSIIVMGGGVAIFLAIALPVALAAMLISFPAVCDLISQKAPDLAIHIEGFLSKRPALGWVLAAGLLLHLAGLWDDIKRLNPQTKLIFQFLAAFSAVWGGQVRVEMFIDNLWVTSFLSIIWIVLIVNVFNFLDNMDGASAGIAAIVCAALMIAAHRSGQVFVGGFAALVIGALAGFLLFNFPPARIFMGDAGSLVVGYFVAILTLQTTYYNPAVGTPLYSVFMPLIVLAVPLYDFISVMYLRIKQGKNPLVGDTQHFSHRLARRGFSDRQVALTLYMTTLTTAIGALIVQQVNLFGAAMVMLQTVCVMVVVGIFETLGTNKAA